jgi:hypothetical protein
MSLISSLAIFLYVIVFPKYMGLNILIYLILTEPRKPRLTAAGLRCADHATPSIP